MCIEICADVYCDLMCSRVNVPHSGLIKGILERVEKIVELLGLFFCFSFFFGIVCVTTKYVEETNR